MNKAVITTLVTVALGTSFGAKAGVCAKYQPVTNGCSMPTKTVLEEVINGVAKPFRDIWRDQCNTHDINYQILGKSKQSSDSKLYSDMRSRCDSKFNKYLLAPLNQSCRLAALAVYEVMKDISPSDYYLPGQRNINDYTNDLSDDVNNGTCDMTPEYAGIYDQSLIDYVVSTFKSINNRKPSAYERLELLKLYNPDSTLYQWQSDVAAVSQSMGSTGVAEIKLSNAHQTSTFIKDASASVGYRLQYDWDLNYGSKTGAVYTKGFRNAYNATYNIFGTLKVSTMDGGKDLVIIDESFFSRGFCANHEGQYCF